MRRLDLPFIYAFLVPTRYNYGFLKLLFSLFYIEIKGENLASLITDFSLLKMKAKPISTVSDEQLVARLQYGDKSAMGELYLRYHMVVFAKCLSFSKNKEHAQDLTQDIMLRVMEKINSFKGSSKFSTWLFSITYNYCTDQLRKGKWKNIDSLENYFNVMDESDVEKERLSEEENKIKWIDAMMKQISSEDQQILVMKYQLNKSIQELQDLYNLSASAVKMRLMRARIKAIGRLKLQEAA